MKTKFKQELLDRNGRTSFSHRIMDEPSTIQTTYHIPIEENFWLVVDDSSNEVHLSFRDSGREDNRTEWVYLEIAKSSDLWSNLVGVIKKCDK